MKKLEIDTHDGPVIDLEKLYELSGNSKSIVNNIIQVFLNETPQQIEKLTALVAAKNWDSVRTLSHNMKSSYAILGANSVQTLLQTLEMQCELNKIDEDAFGLIIDRIIGVNQEVIKSIHAKKTEYGE